MSSDSEIGAYEAKTRLPELLRKVQAGARFTITQRGKPVADLVPVVSEGRHAAAEAATRMRRFMQTHEPVRGADVRALLADGRD